MYPVGLLPLLPWRLKHCSHVLLDSDHCSVRRVRTFQPYCAVSPSPSKARLPHRRSRSGLQRGRVRLLFPQPLSFGSALSADDKISPGNAHPPLRGYPSHLQPCFPYRYRALKILALSPDMAAFYALAVRRTSVLPSRSVITADTLGVRLTCSRPRALGLSGRSLTSGASSFRLVPRRLRRTEPTRMAGTRNDASARF
jgi:hypothetical protein